MGCSGGALFLLTVALAGGAPEQPATQAPEGTRAPRRVITAGRVSPKQPFSPGVLAGATLYLSGQPGRDPSMTEPGVGIRAQTRHAMENIGAVLGAAGMGYANLVKCHVYLASMDDYAGMNEAYGRFFSGRVPARTTVQAAGLPHGADVVIACVAYADLSRISVVQPPKGSLPSPLGPYSAGVWAGDTLYLSGMGGQFPDGRPTPAGLGPQVRQTLINIGTTLQAAGLAFSDVISGEAYLTAPEEAAEFPEAYASSFAPKSAPPQLIVFLPRLPGNIKAEMTLVAARRAGDLLYARAESGEDAGSDFEAQYRAVLRRQEATLRAAGLGWADVTDVQVYLRDLGHMDRLDSIFRETFPQDPPARTTIQVLSGGTQQVQSSFVAVKKDTTR